MVDGHRSHAPALIRPAEARCKTASIWGRSSILDFGCGRLIRSLRPVCDPWAAIYATDVDATAIAWCKDNIADASFLVNGQNPPLRLDRTSPISQKSILFLSFLCGIGCPRCCKRRRDPSTCCKILHSADRQDED
jgi:hypothetical protein